MDESHPGVGTGVASEKPKSVTRMGTDCKVRGMRPKDDSGVFTKA